MSETQVKYPNVDVSNTLEQISKLSLSEARLKLQDEIEKYNRLIKEREKMSICRYLVYLVDPLKEAKDRLSCFYKYALWLLYKGNANPKIKFETYLTGKYGKNFDIFCSDWKSKNVEKEIRAIMKEDSKNPPHPRMKED